MALLSCSPPVLPLPLPQMDRSFSRTTNPRSTPTSTRSSSVSLREIQEESPTANFDREDEEEEEEEKIYVALGKEVKEGRANLLWVLQNTVVCDKKMVVVVHVHRAATKIPMMGAYFAVNQLEEQEVMVYWHAEREKMNKYLKEYLEICASQKVRADKVVIEKDDVAQGLVEFIAENGITNLVMGAAADKHYSRRMKAPRSKKAQTVQQQADQSCKISFVCKGKLICTREVGEVSDRVESSTTSPSTGSSMSEKFRSISLPQRSSESFNVEGLLQQRSRSVNFTSNTELAMVTLSCEQNVAERWDDCSNHQPSSGHEMLNNNAFSSIHKNEEIGEGSIVLPSLHETEQDFENSSSHDEMEDMCMDNALYEKLKDAFIEAENLKREAYEESRRRQKAERDLIEVSRKVKTAENLYIKEVKQRKEIEERLARENAGIEQHKQQYNQILDELKKVNEQTLAYELQIRDSDHIVKDFEGKLSEAYHLLEKYRKDRKELLQERDNAVKEMENLRRNKEEPSSSSHGKLTFSEFSYSELKQATNNFDESLKIGEGGYGSVYKGFLRHTSVAIKMLNPDGIQGELEFNQEVEILSKVRHPNLVTLIGACTEVCALVYEFLPNGSLEDRLACKHQSQPLTWKARARIAAEICSALIFLHSSKPQCIVHGDLKTANILLDANWVSKLGDFGICRLLNQSNTTNTPVHRTYNPKGTFAYMDPDYIASGELTPQSDVYSYGIILLRLLTGKPAFRINKVVQEAMDKGSFLELLDASAGEWPFEQAKELANLGLRCCDLRRKSRPELGKEVWKVLESMSNAATSIGPSWSFRSDSDGSTSTPSYFLCPILQAIMRDPQIAADGFTYEAKAIKEWIHSGHDTSPMTNLKLSNCELIPNHSLRSAIIEWLQKREFM